MSQDRENGNHFEGLGAPLKAETRVQIPLGPHQPTQHKQREKRIGGRPGEHTLADWIWAKYWPVISLRFSPLNLPRERSILSRATRELGHLPLAGMCREHVDGWYARLAAVSKAETINKYRYRVRHVFATACEWGYLTENPAAHLRRQRPPRGRVRWLTDEQRVKLMEAAPPELLAYIIATRETGARRSTLVSMTRRMVDLEAGVITFPVTKNGEPHTVPITSRLGALLTQLGVKRMRDEAYVLPRLHAVSISRAFTRLTRQLNIKDFHFHDLLHDACTHLAQRGATARVIQAYRGHLDARMTARYTHMPLETLRGVMEGGLG